MTLREIFEAELAAHGLEWCRGCPIYRSHKRGYSIRGTKVVHLDSEIATRSALHRGLHEIGHHVNDEAGLRSFECEALANQFAERRMRELGVRVPRKVAAAGRDYVARKRRHGQHIQESRFSQEEGADEP